MSVSQHVFISYHRADRPYVDKLATHLRAGGVQVWYDYDLEAGDRFDKTIQIQIDNCAAFIVVMTPEASESHWVGVEVVHALTRKKPILPLLLRGDVFLALNTIEYEDVRGARLPADRFTVKTRLLVGAEEGTFGIEEAVRPRGLARLLRNRSSQPPPVPARHAVRLAPIPPAEDYAPGPPTEAALWLLEVAGRLYVGLKTEWLEDFVVRVAMSCLISGSHLLIDDDLARPKASLTRRLGALVGGPVHRVVVNSGMDESDLIGRPLYDAKTAEVRFQRGPIFTNVLLLEDLQEASSRFQGALGQALQDRRVATDGVEYELLDPFVCVGSRNRGDDKNLSQALINRFSASVAGPTDEGTLRAIISGSSESVPLPSPVITAEGLSQMTKMVDSSVLMGQEAQDYLGRSLAAIRDHPRTHSGVTNLAIGSVVRLAKPWALLAGRHFVAPNDMRDLLVSVLGHRLRLSDDRQGERSFTATTDVIMTALATVKVPRPTRR